MRIPPLIAFQATLGAAGMIQFADGNGKMWSFRGVTSRVERLRDLTGVDLGLNYDTDGLKKYQELLEDRTRAIEFLQAAVEEQEEAHRLSADEWDELWPTDRVIDALFAIGKEAARFFIPLRSKAASSSLHRLETEYRKILAEMEQAISTADLRQTAADS
jgi:hypothetical protein